MGAGPAALSAMLLDHIAIAVPRMAEAPAVLGGVLGGAPTGAGGPSGAYTWAQWGFAGGGRLEILEPLGADGFLHRFLATRGPGIHHVTFKVPDLDAVCARAKAHGLRIVGRDESDPSWAEAFLHPKEALGIVVQLVESRVPEPPRPPFPAPAGPTDPPAPVAILGLRVSARTAERADTLWRAVLAGRRSGATYRWPGSPMRIVVDVDSSADEGPLAIEYAATRMVDWPGGEPIALGTRFQGAEHE
jgi:catechol 2,3-dioxygenase-like lactoylglutathione lyase family enzyme